MPAIGAFFTGLVGSVAGAGVTSFFTQTIVGRLLVSVAVSALSQAFATKPRKPGIRTSHTMTGGVTPASFVLGVYATEGQLVCPPMSHGKVGKAPNAYLTYVIELGDVPGQTLEGLIIDGEEAEITATEHADYGYELGGRFTNSWIRYYDGSQSVADAMLLDKYGDDPERPWTADMIGTGINYAVLTFRYDRKVYQSFPKVRFIMGGIPLYDPRHDDTAGGSGDQRGDDPATWAPSENLGVQAYNIMRGIALPDGEVWGGGIEADDLPLSSWFAAMNAADAEVSLAAGGTEARYRTSYEVFVSDEPAAILEELLKGGSGQVAEVGGVWKVRIGAPGLPVWFFTDDDINISESQSFAPYPDSGEVWNAVNATYPDPEALWNSVDAPARLSAEYEAEDGGQRRAADLSLSAVPYQQQVQRLMRAYLKDGRRMRRHTVALAPDAIPLEPLDIVGWTSARNGYDAKRFEIAAMVDPLVTSRPQISIRERNPADYDWSSDDELPVDLPSTVATVVPSQAVATWAVAATTIKDASGTDRRPAIVLTWDGADQDDIEGLRYRVRLKSSGHVILRGRTEDAEDGVEILSEGILPLTEYEVRVRWKPRSGRDTEWSDWVSVTTPDVRTDIVDVAPDLWDLIAGATADAQAALAEQVAWADDLAGRVLTSVQQGHRDYATFEGLRTETRRLEASYGAFSASVEQTFGVYANDISALAVADATLQANIDTVSADLNLNYYTSVQTDGAISTAVSAAQITLQSNIDTISADLTANYYTSTETDGEISTAVSGAQTTLQSNIDSLSSNLSTNYYTATQTDGEITAAVSAAQTTLQSNIDTVSADLSTNYYTSVQTDGAISTAVSAAQTTLQSNIDSVSADLSSNYYTSAQTDGEISSAITTYAVTVTSAIDTLSTSITYLDQSVDGVYGVHAIAINNNGHISGFGLVSDLVDSQPVSSFLIQADEFSVVSTDGTSSGVPFVVYTSTQTIDGVSVPAGTYIKSAHIMNGAIDTAQIQDLAVDAAKIKDAAISNAKIKDTIKSSNYSAGSAGWKIDKSGTAEFHDLVVRDWIQDNQITDKVSDESATAEYVSNGTVYLSIALGAIHKDEFWHISAALEARNSGTHVVGGSTEDLGVIITVQSQVKENGSWSSWAKEYQTSLYTGGWKTFDTVFHMSGEYEAAVARVKITHNSVSTGAVTQNNVKNAVLMAQSLSRK